MISPSRSLAESGGGHMYLLMRFSESIRPVFVFGVHSSADCETSRRFRPCCWRSGGCLAVYSPEAVSLVADGSADDAKLNELLAVNLCTAPLDWDAT